MPFLGRQSVGSFPHTNVQFSFIPSGAGVEYVAQLVETAQRAGHFAGRRADQLSRAKIYRFLAGTGAPGGGGWDRFYPDQLATRFVDLDYRTSGRLLAEHLVGRGSSAHCALFATGGGTPGGSCFLRWRQRRP